MLLKLIDDAFLSHKHMHGANVQNVCSRHCFCRWVLKNIYLVILYFLRRIITNHFGTMQLCNTINVHAVKL